jgi:hypothetical protein
MCEAHIPGPSRGVGSGRTWLETGYDIEFSNTTKLDKAPRYMNCFIKETIEIKLHPRIFNRDRDFSLSQSWYSVTNMIKQCQKTRQPRDKIKPSKIITAPSSPNWLTISSNHRLWVIYRWDNLDHMSHQAMMRGTEVVPETSIIFNHLIADSPRGFY